MAGLAAGSYFIVLGGLSEIEKGEGIDDCLRAQNYIDYKTASVDQMNRDWAYWDSSYFFMDDKNQEYIEENLPGFIFENLDLNSILFYDERGNYFYGKYFSHYAGDFSDVPESLRDAVAGLDSVKNPENSDGVYGFLLAEDKLYIISANPVLKSDLTGPAKGTLVMAKEVSDEYISEISGEIKLSLELEPIPHAYAQGAGENERIIETSYKSDGLEMYVSTMLYGVDEKPVAVLKLTEGRDIFRIGFNTVLFYSVYAIIICAVIIVVLNILLDSLFIRRIEYFSSEIKRIADTADYSSRLSDQSGDEISSISDSANSLLQTIEDSIKSLRVNNEELKRTLEKKSVLVAELHHRVKNNLQYIISLLGIKSLKIRDPEGLAVINEATNRIKYLGMIHDDLYNKEDRESLYFREHLLSLGSLVLGGVEQDKRKKISVNIYGDEFPAELSYAMPLSTALYELLRNSAEHAFDENGGEIEILYRKKGFMLEVTVRDNGVGLESKGARKAGFGISNARSVITKQLGGTLENIPSERGTCWIITIDLKKFGDSEKGGQS